MHELVKQLLLFNVVVLLVILFIKPVSELLKGNIGGVNFFAFALTSLQLQMLSKGLLENIIIKRWSKYYPEDVLSRLQDGIIFDASVSLSDIVCIAGEIPRKASAMGRARDTRPKFETRIIVVIALHEFFAFMRVLVLTENHTADVFWTKDWPRVRGNEDTVENSYESKD